jgi:RNase adaptor protein for sRNA GlmZ degradation
MSIAEIKSEIHKVVDNVPEEILESVLAYLKELSKTNNNKIALSLNLKQILIEDRELLQKLAE